MKKPGPIGTTCLTCRRRRKKCDRAHPICKRCTVGGFVCLGYDDEGYSDLSLGQSAVESNCSHSSRSSESSHSPRAIMPKVSSWPCLSSPNLEENSGLFALTSASPLKSGDIQPVATYNVSSDHRSLQHGRSTQRAEQASTFTQLGSVEPTTAMGHFNGATRRALSLDFHRSSTSERLSCVSPSPSTLSPVVPEIMATVNFVISQYQRLINISFLTPPQELYLQLGGIMSLRLQHSDIDRHIKYLGCKIFETIMDGALPGTLEGYISWFLETESRLRATPEQFMVSPGSYHHASALLEICFLKMMFVDGMGTYQILHNAAPLFLQLVYSDTSLWLNPTDPTSLSLAHVLGSSHYELARFVLMDALYSMVYGLPQVIEYDTSVPSFEPKLRPVEWVHGCPITLKSILVELNNRCNSRNRAGPVPDWQPIERRIKSWVPTASTQLASGDESWKIVAKLAVYESWRHTLLIYLYMGVCKLRSDDPRVQASVQQVFQLTGSVRNFETPSIDIHFLAQYIVAGACARGEKQRSIAREKLAATFHDGLWLLRGSEFVPILDHLWHGVASGGQPIYWSDYIHSREVCIEIPRASVFV